MQGSAHTFRDWRHCHHCRDSLRARLGDCPERARMECRCVERGWAEHVTRALQVGVVRRVGKVVLFQFGWEALSQGAEDRLKRMLEMYFSYCSRSQWLRGCIGIPLHVSTL